MAVTWTGLDRLLADLDTLPADLTTDADGILTARAETARSAIAAAYTSAALRRGLVLTPAPDRVAGRVLRQRAPHGYLYEHGSRDRENKAGANRGRMPAHPTFVPIAAPAQKAAIAAVVDRLYVHGATRVSGDATTA